MGLHKTLKILSDSSNFVKLKQQDSGLGQTVEHVVKDRGN